MLDLVDEKTSADGMKASTRNVDVLPSLRLDGVNEAIGGAFFERFSERGFGYSGFDSNVEFGTGLCVGNIPDFRLRLSSELF